jgi:TRAP-type C4-dicarboxylate transport system permease small subunit
MKFERIINCIIPKFGGVLLLFIVLLTFMQIILREFLNFSLNWSDEISQFSMSWLALFGSIWVTQNNRHLNTGLKLHQNLNKRQVYLIDGILALLIATISGVVAYQTIIFSFSAVGVDSLSIPGFKMGYVFIALPIFMLTVCYYYLKSFFENMACIFKKS